MTARLNDFLDFSVELTAFTRFELLGTGQAQAYYDQVEKVVGSLLGELLDAYAKVPPDKGPARMAALRREIFGNEKLGPIARGIAKLWYIGIWYALPRAWTEAYGALANNTTVMVSASSYAEGLLWVAIGAHPPGAKAPGYGSWAAPPRIPEFGGAPPCSCSPAPPLVQAPAGGVTPPHATLPQHPPPAQETRS